jgi:GNAT superfamily N-acetyltransferase
MACACSRSRRPLRASRRDDRATHSRVAGAGGSPVSPQARGEFTIAAVTAADLDDLLPLMRAYCDFYGTAPRDEELLALARSVLAEPALEGVQLIARDARGEAVAFASLFWSWDTTEAARIGIMNDLYVAPQARGGGLADALIAACLERCGERGARRLEWETGPDNLRAQRVYERVGGRREPWLVYVKEVGRP